MTFISSFIFEKTQREATRPNIYTYIYIYVDVILLVTYQKNISR